MKATNIKLKFKDTKKVVEFSSADNIIFYGINGKGKTRVLRTLFLLHKLAKEDRLRNFSEIIDSLNLSELFINKENMENLFSNNTEFNRVRNENLYQFVKSEESAFRFASSRLDDVFELYEFELSSSERMRYKRINQMLSQIFDNLESKRMKKLTDLPDVEKLLSEIRFFITRLRSNHIINFDKSNDKIDYQFSELVDVNNYLRDKLNLINYEFSNNSFIDVKSRMLEYRKAIDSIFKTNKIRYISTELIENIAVFGQIKEKIQSINQHLIDVYWSNQKEIDVKSLKEEIFNRIVLFNEIISRYDDIKFELKSDGEIKFYKNKSLLEFEKFSSGEKRIIIIFLNLVMFDDNTLLIDEPEISLSLNYQSKIIFDLMKYKGNKNLMIATHAPFIFEDFCAYQNNVSIEV